jgi:hypothetical protein
MAAADLVQFRRLLVDIDLKFGSAATIPAAAGPPMPPPITAIRSGAVNGSLSLCRLPVRQRLVRLRDRRIHDVAVLTGSSQWTLRWREMDSNHRSLATSPSLSRAQIDVAGRHYEGHALEHRDVVDRARIHGDHIGRFA